MIAGSEYLEAKMNLDHIDPVHLDLIIFLVKLVLVISPSDRKKR